jgi:hypothetical protein
MNTKNIMKFSGGLLLSVAFSTFTTAQDTTQKTTTTKTTTKTEVIQKADGSYSVIEYPVGKEVTVELSPLSMAGAKGMARVMRMADGTKVYVDLNGISGDTKSFYAYAIDPSGMPTLLGPVMVENGLAKGEFTTPMNQFMLVLSPNEGLTAIDPTTPLVFRSQVPQGYAVVANRPSSNVATDEKQVANSVAVTSTYEVPLLGISGLEKGETEIRVKFAGELEGLKGKAYIDNSKAGVTKIKMRFDDMKLAPKQKRYVLWAVSPTKEFTKIGQVINTGRRQEAEIRGETALADFGLFVTMEDKDVLQPSGTVYAPFSVGSL